MRKTPTLWIALCLALVALTTWWFASSSPADAPGPAAPTVVGPGAGGDVASDASDRSAIVVGGEPAGATGEQGMGEADSRKTEAGNVIRGRLVGVSVDWTQASIVLIEGGPGFEDALFDAMRSGFRNMEEQVRTGGFKRLREGVVEWETVRAEADGSFEIRTSHSGPCEIEVRHRVVRLRDAVEFELPEPARDRGTVVHALGDVDCEMAASVLVFVEDVDGRAVSDASVRLSRPFDPMSFMNLETGAPDFSKVGDLVRPVRTTTDARGLARFSGLEAGGEVGIHAVADGHGPAERRAILVAGRERVVRLRLPAAARLRVRLVDDTGAAVEGVRVAVDPITDDVLGMRVNSDPQRRRIRGRSDKDGTVVLDSLPSGACKVGIEPRGFVGQDHEVRLEAGRTVEREFVLDRGASVSGVVRDDLGQPLEGASVGNVPMLGQKVMGFKLSSFVPDVALTEAAKSRGIQTDAEGRFELSGLVADDDVQIVVTKAGHSASFLDAKPGDRDIEVELERRASVTGKVTREEDGKPIEEFTVSAVERAFLVIETKLGRQETSPGGVFTLSDLPQGAVTIEVEAVGRAPRRIDVRLDLDDVATPVDVGVIQLAPPSAIEGVVVDATGNPVAGAVVRPARGGLADMEFVAKLRGEQSVTTGDDGKFRLVGLPARRMRLRVEKSGFAMLRSKTFGIEKGKTLGPIKLVLERGSTVDGMIMDADRVPLEGWLISLKSQNLGLQKTARSDAQGRVRFEAVADGTYRIEGIPEDFVANMSRMSMRRSSSGKMPDIGKMIGEAMNQAVTGKIDVPKNGQTQFELTTKKSAAAQDAFAKVEGRVTIGSAPLRSGFVEFHALGGTRQQFATVTDGAFEIDGLAPGSYEARVRTELLQAGARDGRTIRVPDSGTIRIDLELPGGKIAGRVVSPSGKAIPHALVRLTSASERRMFDSTELVEIGSGVSLTDEDGRFSFEGLAAGEYSVVARELGFTAGPRSARVEGLMLSEGQAMKDVVVELAQGAMLRVLVRSSDASPVVGARVRALDSTGVPLASFESRSTDERGEAVLRGLAPGVYRVLVDASDHAAKVSDVVALRADQEASRVISLSAGVRVRARFAGTVPEAARGQVVVYSLWDSSERLVRAGSVRVPEAVVGERAERAFDLGRLSPGRYRARLESVGFGVLEEKRDVPSSGDVVWSFSIR